MAQPSKAVLEFKDKHGVATDEMWEVRPGIWAVKHMALERIAAEQGIEFDRPEILEINTKDKIAVVCVFGKLKDHQEWSIGEASPHNNKNSYPAAMAEKRAKDRVTLKLLKAHGAVYSDSEADDFAGGDGKPAQLAKKDAKEIYSKMQREIREAVSSDQLKLWADTNADRIGILPDDWQDILRLQYQEQILDLRQKEAA